jgi:hypothetical protein
MKQKTTFIILFMVAAAAFGTGMFLYLRRDTGSAVERIRDEIMEEIKVKHPETKQFIMDLSWSGGRVTLPNIVGAETHEYQGKGWIVTIEYAVTPNPEYSVTADYSVSRLPGYVGIPYRIVWQGTYRNGVISETSYVFAQ